MSIIALLNLFLLINLTLASDPAAIIIIIGAGPAGIAAASKLLENSFTNIKIFEAERKIGGRINSIKFGEEFVDLGAEYCHGQKDNIVYELVKNFNVLEPISADFHVNLFYSNGSRLNDDFTEELQAAIFGYDSNNFEYNTTGVSIGEVFLKKYNATVVAKYANNEKIGIVREALKLAEQVSLVIDGAFSWFDTSAVKHYERSEGHQLLVWKGRGYKTILKVLTKEFPDPSQKLPIDDKIFLNRQVSKVSWKENGGKVVVETTDNSTYAADHVIFTPSIGVLKEQKDVLFHPHLPSSKLDAIEAIGIAGVMKLILHFETEWWKKDDTIFALMWSEKDLRNSAREFPQGPVKDGISWLSGITLMAKVPGNPNVLIAWITGPFVPEIEQTAVNVLLDGCTCLLKRFFGQNYNVSAPDQLIKSMWRSNPHFRGTYSYDRVGFDVNNIPYRENLAEPLEDHAGRPVVLFAGEATNPIHYSTVHGAIESGFREAKRLINLYKNVYVPR